VNAQPRDRDAGSTATTARRASARRRSDAPATRTRTATAPMIPARDWVSSSAMVAPYARRSPQTRSSSLRVRPSQRPSARPPSASSASAFQ
jgi:hypothetical protein